MNGNSQFEPLTGPSRRPIVSPVGLRKPVPHGARTVGDLIGVRGGVVTSPHPSGGHVARIRLLVIASCAAILFAVMLVAVPRLGTSHLAAAGAPPTAPAAICGNSGVLQGPSRPDGAVSVPAGNNSALSLDQPNTTYWFAPGTHTLGSSALNQIIP